MFQDIQDFYLECLFLFLKVEELSYFGSLSTVVGDKVKL